MKSFHSFLLENKQSPIPIAIYPGRFQPVHIGHKAVYDFLVRNHDVCYICTSNKTEEKSPLTFEEKQYLLTLIGIPKNRVIEESLPYNPKKIYAKIHKTPEQVAFIFGVGKKDMETDPRFSFTLKKNGEKKYYQPYISDKGLEDSSVHGYIDTVPTVEFSLLGKKIKSASEIRSLYKQSDDATRKEIIKQLYGKFDEKAYEILNKKLS